MASPSDPVDLSIEERIAKARAFWASLEGGTTFAVQLSEEQAFDLASGYVPQAVKAAILDMLDFREQDQRRAQRPVPTTKTTNRKIP